MNSDPNALTERVISSFEKLSSAAKNLNNVSDELGRAITAIDYILQRLNLGVPTWVKIHGGEDQYTGMEYWSRDVGYAKIGNRWGIALCTRKGDYNNPDEEEFESWLFNDAPRWLRVEGVEKIPDLLEALIKNTEETTAKIKGKIDHAKQLAGALEQAAAGKPASKKAFMPQAFDEDSIEVSVRPKRLDEYIGQIRVKENIQIAIDAARSRGEALDHVLLDGPPGLGKTTSAQIIANE